MPIMMVIDFTPDRKFGDIRRCEFDEAPCTPEQARAHLTLMAPDGVVILAKPRGPRGGWPWVRYIDDKNALHIHAYRGHTLHLGGFV